MSAIDWQKLYAERKAAEKKFGALWELPIKKRYHVVLAEQGATSCRLLEVGAGDRGVQNTMKKYWGEFAYTSCDIDPTYEHDFNDIADVVGEFDLVAGFEVIEHVTLEQAIQMLTKCQEVLVPGGKVVFTTPNTYYPPAYLRDATHITPFCYDELAAAMAVAGLKPIKIYRLYHDSLIKKFLKRILFYPLFRILGIDFAHQIAVVGEKVESPK